MDALSQYLELFSSSRDLIERHAPRALNLKRDAALEILQSTGLPDRKTEEYRYFDIRKIFEPDYGLNVQRLREEVRLSEVFSCDVPDIGSTLALQVNDGPDPALLEKARQSLPDGVFLGTLSSFQKEHGEVLEAYYGTLSLESGDAVSALNTLLVQDGLVLFVPREVSVSRPIQIVNVLESLSPRMVNRRLLVILQDGSSARILCCDHTMDQTSYLSTQVIEVWIGPNASLELYELEENGPGSHRVSNLYVHQEASSHFRHSQLTLSGGFTRNATQVRLQGREARVELYGMALADASQIVDNRTLVCHQAPYGQSTQLYKYVLNDRSQGAFSGLVNVLPGAHHTSSSQTNRNLCATREAHMYTQPQLVINNDDVKCSHGAAVGQLDENALFYMRQRGIPLDQARMLLMFAFVGDVVDSIALESLRTRLHLLVEKRFRGELNRGCAACRMCRETQSNKSRIENE